MPGAIKGIASLGKLQDQNLSSDEKLDFIFATVQKIGASRAGLEVLPTSVYEVSAAVAVEAGSNASNVTITGHLAKPGDFIRIVSAAGNPDEYQMGIKRIVDANNFELNGVLSAALQAGDTIDILRPVINKATADGSSTATVTSPPLQFNEETGSGITAVTVLDDQVTPANSKPLPVKLTSVTGDINITANDINVQLSHTGANPDSVQIGNGTNIASINASGEVSVVDSAGNALLTTIDADTSALAGCVAGTELQVDIVSAGPIATEATLGTINTNIATIAGAVSGTEMQVDIVATGGIALDTTLSAMSAKLPASLGQKARAASLSVTQSTEDQTRQDAIRTAVETVAGAVSGSEMQVDLVGIGDVATETTLSSLNGKDFSTETTLAAMSAKLPASLGQKTGAASLSVVPASDYEQPIAHLDITEFAFIQTSSTNITNAAYVEVIASTAAAIKKISYTEHSGAFYYIATGAASSEVDKFIIPEGGEGEIEVNIPAGTRLSIIRVEAGTSAAGGISLNFLG